jgi:hypothetical protein
MRYGLLILIASGLWLAGNAHAQLRTLPPNAIRATVDQQQYPLPYISLNGAVLKLAPGGVIYDRNNRSIVQGALPPGADVVYTTDMNGDVARIYILTHMERAQLNQQQ